jgi:hypothetical protein
MPVSSEYCMYIWYILCCMFLLDFLNSKRPYRQLHFKYTLYRTLWSSILLVCKEPFSRVNALLPSIFLYRILLPGIYSVICICKGPFGQVLLCMWPYGKEFPTVNNTIARYIFCKGLSGRIYTRYKILWPGIPWNLTLRTSIYSPLTLCPGINNL